ncbi:fucosyltransferase 11 [Hibiscus trionum]|uniref:Fucosyltransferase n=1 Tax=Hibiscus trionum TaxID=183268 RepID=A0A9W7IZX2_HIBTR|nr:fucosyltransferase 11 [Hibiscus trionum]
MGIVPKLRGARTHEGLPISDGLSHFTSASNNKKWLTSMSLLVALVVIAEIGFVGRLGIIKNADIFGSLPAMFRKSHTSARLKAAGARNFGIRALGGDRNSTCEEWLEREDAVVYSRDFSEDPILVSGDYPQELKTCAVGCKIGSDPSKKPDAIITQLPEPQAPCVLRTMESTAYYPENSIALARRRGYEYVMTTSLSSDVPVGYFSWAEYDIMAPVIPKTKSALAAAFISNCDARNFRIQALVGLEKENIKIDSYGICHGNQNGGVDKVETLKHYKFSLAFENSNEEDYVSEKFFQSLVAGSVPVVVGAPNIEDFSPSPGSYLHIKETDNVHSVAERMKYLAKNPDAYNQSLRWKYEGPSDSFKALLDMAAVHSSCRLCIHLATIFLEEEEKNSDIQKRPCKCETGSETVYHLYVRERGRFEVDSIFLRSGDLTLEALEAAVLKHFKSRKHEPIWKRERPESIRGDELKVYRIYPLGLTQRQALYTFKFKDDVDLRNHIENNPCAKFEIIFV